jgi:hypothetical protein
MKSFTEFREEKQRLDPKCWDGYKKKGTKMKGDTRVNDCVKEEEYDTPAVKKPVSQMTPAEKKKNDERRTAYNTFQKMRKGKVNEDIDKTIARHESGIRKANAAIKTATGNQQMVKHMNALTHHKKALKHAMMRQSMQEEGIKSGHKRPTEDGAGLTQKGVDAHRRENPGSKLQTAVTTPPSKLKPGSKAAGRRKSFCARSRSWTGERGKAARRRWNC